MAEKLKVFKDVVNQTTIGDYDIVATDATTQAVINEAQYKVTGDSLVATDIVFKAGNKVLDTYTVEPNEVYEAKFVSGTTKEIIDINSSLTLSLECPVTAYELPPIKMLIFGTANGLMLDSFSGTRNDHTDYAYSTMTRTLSSNTTISNTNQVAISAFTVDISGETYYCRNLSGIVYRYDSIGTLVQTYPAFSNTPSSINGVCTDSTYFYGISTSANTLLQRINIATGLVDTGITLSPAVDPQEGSGGSYTLYYDGYIYVKRASNSNVIYKINPTAGAVSQLVNTPSAQVGSYSAGGIITVAIDGTPYIVEYGDTAWTKTNILTGELKQFIHSVSISTEYGNAAFELSRGVVGFLHSYYIYFVNVNTDTGTRQLPASTYKFPTVTNNCSIAQKPIHEYNDLTPVTKNISYDVYASGVEITGV